MPRTARIDLPEMWYHIIARGHNRKTIFFDAQDYRTYLRYSTEALAGQAVLGGYCLMPNHVHLLVNRRQKTLGRIFHDAHGKYGQYFNKKYARTGYVFQNRFKSCLVLKQEYLDTLVGYIHNNPVRAKMCVSAMEYRWSTDAAYRQGKFAAPDLFRFVPGYDGVAGKRRYELLMATDIAESPYFDNYIGTKSDLRDIERRSRSRNVGIERRGKPDLLARAAELAESMGVTLRALQDGTRKRNISGTRQAIMAILYREQYPPSAIGRLLGRTATAVFLAANRKS